MSDPSPESQSAGRAPATAEACVLEGLQSLWGWFLVLGIILVFLGMLAIGASFVASLATVLVFGTLLMVSGGMQMIASFFSRKWGGFFQELLVGILLLVVGLLMVTHPLAALASLTLLVAAFFLVSGIARIVMALSERFENWAFVLATGVINLLLGILIWSGWPASALWVIGLFVGIEMLFRGWTWIMLALAARNVAKGAG
jgi:uncharacterized membrane protein HdeD (DUF308 family)